MRHDLIVLAILSASMPMMVAQQTPKVLNAKFESRPAGASLSATVNQLLHSPGPLWLGYEVAAVPQLHFSVCSGGARSTGDDECCDVFRLEDSDNSFRSSDNEQPAQTNVDVLIRIDQGVVDKVRFIATGCSLDAGGLPFTWLTDVKADDSVAWLSSQVTAENPRRTDQALAALAVHQTSKATAALESFSAASTSRGWREKASFWLGAERGHDGLSILEKLKTDSDPEFRKKLSFDFSLSHDSAAVDDLIGLAKSDPDTGVREQAIFWVAQKAGKKAVGALNDAIENDPETAVKKKAVFALSQLPKDEAVPELLRVAQTNQNAAVRKDAIFWLGQTHDLRALAYFEQILEHQ
jgi:hypothetical protein